MNGGTGAKDVAWGNTVFGPAKNAIIGQTGPVLEALVPICTAARAPPDAGE